MELAPHRLARRGSYSSGTGGECLEVADNLPGAVVPVRDSKNPNGPALLFGDGAWAQFVDGLKTARP